MSNRGWGARVCLFCLCACRAAGQTVQEPPARPEVRPVTAGEKAPATSAVSLAEKAAGNDPGGEIEAASARRNENIHISPIDNNALRDALVRLGASITPVQEPGAAADYYAAEFGRTPAEFPYLKPHPQTAWHGELWEFHQNGAVNARTFFQVGPVAPSRQNYYGLHAGGPIRGGALWIEGAQRRIRGMVNGNVLVPAPEERAPRTQDPATRGLLLRYLAGYPAAPPNRTEFDPRALNLNAPQTIDEDRLAARWDVNLPRGRQLWLRYQYQNEFKDSFQLVAGQNPDSTLGSQLAQITVGQPFRGSGAWTIGLAFQRLRTLLVAEPNAVGPLVRFGQSIESLGPRQNFPVDRVENSFRAGSQWAWIRGSHRLTAGAEITRFQLNGAETNNHRGHFSFAENFGRSAIENFLQGTPTWYRISLGDPTRGFRNLGFQTYLGDEWQLSPRWHLNLGLRYSLETAPGEVNGRTIIPYDCDCNNLSPRFGFALQGGSWGLIRGAYTLSYSPIAPASYQQARFNPPGIVALDVLNPDLVQPLRDFDLSRLGPNTRSALLSLSPELRDPYSHQYTLNWERQFQQAWTLRLGYVGSRNFQLPTPLVTNRSHPVPGIPLTTSTAHQRRADPRYYEVTRIVNMANAYLDAAQAVVTYPWRRGLTLAASYTFGKAIDTGADHTSTGSGEDIIFDAGQWEFETQKDLKGLSRFHSAHALLLHFSYDMPAPAATGLRRALLAGWSLSGAALFKGGTPFSVAIGSDSPGFGNVDGRSADRPHVLDPSVLGRVIDHPDTAARLLPRAAFAFLRPGEPRGNLGRATFRKDGMDNLNLAVTKQWVLPSRTSERRLLLRAEAFNAPNHPQFDEPGRSLANPDFGHITNTLNDGRILQLSLRFVF